MKETKHLYIAINEETGLIKIGISSNRHTRIKHMAGFKDITPFEDLSPAIEGAFKYHFKEYNVKHGISKNECFNISKARALDFIIKANQAVHEEEYGEYWLRKYSKDMMIGKKKVTPLWFLESSEEGVESEEAA